MRYTLVPVPVCPIQLRSKISGEPNSGLLKEPRVVTESNDNTCSQGKKMHVSFYRKFDLFCFYRLRTWLLLFLSVMQD